MSMTGRIALSVKQMCVDGSYVKATHMLNRDLAVPMTPEQHEHKRVKELNFNPPTPRKGYKYCSNCGEEQRIDADPRKSGFSPDKRYRGGFRSWCKTCCAEQSRRWRQTARAMRSVIP